MTIADGPHHEHTTISETPVVGVPVAQVRTSSTARFAPDALIAAGVGLVLIVIGLIAITRGGFKGPMSDPVVEVLGFRHTTTLGLIEIAIGAVLLIAGASRSRGMATFGGLVLVVAGFVGAVQTESFADSLGLESSMAWWAVAAGGVVVLTSLVLPRFARSAVRTGIVAPADIDDRTVN